MSKGRNFIRRQDDEMEACLKAWEKNAKAFLLAAKADAAPDVQKDRLRDWHAAAQEYFRKVDECVSDAGELSGDDYENWLQSRTNTALSAVSGFLTQIGDVREQRDKLGLHSSVYEPSPGFLAHAQSLVAATRPEAAKKFKQQYLAAKLWVDGFENPRIPTASSSEEKAESTPDGALLPPNFRSRRGPMDIAFTALLLVGGLMFACIIAGAFIQALALFFFIVLLTSGLSLACIAGGALAVWKGGTAQTKFKMFGVEFDTKSVGFAFVGVGLVVGYFTVDSVLKRVDLLESHKQPPVPSEAAHDFKIAKDKALAEFQQELASLSKSAKPEDNIPIGTILVWPGPITKENPVPENWRLCDGSELPTNGYENLFKIIGTTWGGSQYAFNLPDFSNRFLCGASLATETGGAKVLKIGTYQEAKLPPHTHDKGNLRVAGGRNPGTAEMLFKVAPEPERIDMNFGIYPDKQRGIDDNARAVNTIDILGEPGASRPIPQAILNEQVMPMNAVVNYIIKVK